MKFIAIVVINKQDVELSIIASLNNVNSDFFQDLVKHFKRRKSTFNEMFFLRFDCIILI